jgi:hypothetical protein
MKKSVRPLLEEEITLFGVPISQGLPGCWKQPTRHGRNGKAEEELQLPCQLAFEMTDE